MTPQAYAHLENATVRIDVEREKKLQVPLHHLGGLVCFGDDWKMHHVQKIRKFSGLREGALERAIFRLGVVKPTLRNFNFSVVDAIHQAMFGGNPARPPAR